MKNVEHKCNVCNRVFATRRALQQHKMAKHETRAPVPRRSRRSVANRPRAPRGGMNVNPAKVVKTPPQKIRVRGEDSFLNFKVKTTGETIQHKILDSNVSKRIGTMAKAFQRYRFLKAKFRVVPTCALTVSGGYVAGFVADPADKTVLADSLLSQQGACLSKIAESLVIDATAPKTLLYTSSSEEIRLQSPGSFWFITQGAPSAETTVVVMLEWEVEFSIPAFEEASEQSFYLPHNVWSKKGNYNLVWYDGDKEMQEWDTIVPTEIVRAKNKSFFRASSFDIEYAEGEGDTGSEQQHFIVYDPNDKKMYYSNNGSAIDTTPWQSDVQAKVVIPCQELCRYVGPKAC